ncbi:MAG: hypothetical protein U0Q16_20585 [Bryobacteraceae bacterium]
MRNLALAALLVVRTAAAAPELTALSAQSGPPGAPITAKLTGVSSLSATPYILFAFDNGPVTLAPADLGEDGAIQFLVPYFIDANQEAGYSTGTCKLALAQKGGMVPLATFEVLPLQPVADPIGKLTDLIRALNRGVLDRIDSQKETLGWADIAGTLRKFNQARTDELLKSIAGADATGTGNMALDVLNPGGDTVPVSKRDLENLASILFGQATAPKAGAESTKALRSEPRKAAPGHCIADALGKPWEDCLDLNYWADQLAESVTTIGLNPGLPGSGLVQALQRVITHVDLSASTVFGADTRRTCSFDASAVSPALVATQLLNIMHDSAILCKLHPVKPVRLLAVPVPNPMPVGQMDAVGNRGTQILLRTEPYWTPEFTVDQFLKRSYDGMVTAALAGDAGCATQLTSAYNSLARQMFDSARNQMLEPLRKIQQQLPSFRETPLYKCDLREIATLSPGSLNRRNDHDDDTNARWGLEGLRAGTYRVEVMPVRENFPNAGPSRYRGGIFTGFEDCDEPPRPISWFNAEITKVSPCVSVVVAGGETNVQISSAYVFSYRGDTGPKNPVRYDPPLSISDTLTLEENSLGAKSMAVIKKVNDTKWQVEQTLEGAPSDVPVTDTWNRLDLQLIHRPGPKPIRVKVSSNISGTCQGLDVNVGTVSRREDGVNGCPAEWTIDTQSSPGTVATTFLQVRAVVLGGRGVSRGPGKGRVLTEIEFLEPGR